MQENASLQKSDLLTDMIIGMSDGLIVSFALTAGLAGAAAGHFPTIAAGLCSVAIGSLAMGIGGYLAGKGEINQTPDDVVKMELPDDVEQTITREIMDDNEGWHQVVNDHGLYAADKRMAKRSGFNIALFYIAGGLIPVLPYFYSSDIKEGLILSSIVTVICLLGFGFFRALVTGQNQWSGALRSTFFGTAAATAAFFIGSLFR